MYKQKRKTCCQKPVEHRIKGTDHSCGDIEELSEKNSGAGVFRAELDDPRGNLCALVLMLAYLKSFSTTFLTPSTPTTVCLCLWSQARSRLAPHRGRSTLSLWPLLPSVTAAQFLKSASLGRAWFQGMLSFFLVIYLTPLMVVCTGNTSNRVGSSICSYHKPTVIYVGLEY